jgi:hypothetical protein
LIWVTASLLDVGSQVELNMRTKLQPSPAFMTRRAFAKKLSLAAGLATTLGNDLLFPTKLNRPV